MNATARKQRGAGWWLAPLRPALIGLAALVVAALISQRTLPVHTIVLWSAVGKKGLAASRDDFEVLLLIAGLLVLAIWLVASLILLVMPARHVLVPHAAYWKRPENRADMRRRFAMNVSRAIGFTYWFLAAEVAVAILSQKDGLLEFPWLPAIVSLLFVIILLVFAVWVFADGFSPPVRASGTRGAAQSPAPRR